MKDIPGIREPSQGQIFSLFSMLPAQTKVILFGSRALGRFREGSDIDIALKGSVPSGDRDRLLSRSSWYRVTHRTEIGLVHICKLDGEALRLKVRGRAA